MHPGKSTKRAFEVDEALKLYYRLAIIPLVLGLIVTYASGGFVSSSMLSMMFKAVYPALLSASGTYALAISMVYMLLFFLAITPLSMLINSWLYHMIVGKLFKIYNKKYAKVFTGAFYGALPTTLVYWLFPLGAIGGAIIGIAGLWGFIVEIIAYSNQLGMSRIKSLLTFVLYWIVAAVVIGVLFVLGAFVFIRLLKPF